MKIIFVPTFHYLTQPFFEMVFKELEGHDVYFLESSEPTFESLNRSFKIKLPASVNTIQSTFPTRPLTGNLLIDSFLIHLYAFSIIRKLKRIKPDAFVFGTDQTPLIRIIDRKFKKTPKIVFQTALLNFAKEYPIKKRYGLKKLIFSILDPFIYPIVFDQKQFGLANPKHHLFLFGGRSLRFYQDKKEKSYLHLTGYPLIKRVQRSDEANKILFYLPVCNNETEEQENYKDFEALITQFSEISFLVKKHPRADQKSFNNFMNKLSRFNVREVSDSDINILYPTLKGVISSLSFGDFQFIYNKIPLIHHRRDLLESHDYWFKDSGVPKSSNELELKKNFENYILEAKSILGQDQYFADLFSSIGQDSSKIIATEIINVAKAKL